MANDFVRNIKGVRNINILSPNITTENDLISTSDGEVYVVTNKGYKKITGGELSANIDTLKSDVKILKSDINDQKISIDNQQTQIETTTSEIETLDTKTDNNTSEIETLKTSTDDNKSEIETLDTKTDNNTSEIETLKTSTDDNKSEIETLKTSTDNNTSEIGLLETKIEDVEINVNNLNENIKKLNEYIEVKSFSGIDLMDKNSLDGLPLGVNYLTRATNKTSEMNTGNGWLTVHYGNNIKRLMFQPYSEGRTYYNYILDDTLEEWQ